MLSKNILEEVLDDFSTLQDLLRWGFSQFQGAELFYGHGTDNAWDEIVYLVLATLKLGPHLNSQWLAARLTREERTQIVQRIKQRIDERLPTAYLVNEAWFAGLSFYVDSRVLIPRSPLAEVIQRHFAPWIEAYRVVDSILDLGTGSGCIAIACAHAFPHAKIDAVDCSKEALTVAAINSAKHKSEHVYLIQSNGFENLTGRCYDIIISNPPYVDKEDFIQLPKEYQYEPAIALAAGIDGLDFIISILHQAKRYLKADGLLVVEVGNSKAALIARFPHMPFVWLEFECSDTEVFILTREQLVDNE